jgi:hypothetical protein
MAPDADRIISTADRPAKTTGALRLLVLDIIICSPSHARTAAKKQATRPETLQKLLQRNPSNFSRTGRY